MTTIYFVRHGESEANRGAWLAGHKDAPLTPTGMAQARQSAGGLAHIPFDAVYSSDLARAAQTARAHAACRGCPVVLTQALREFDAGDLTGMTYEQIAVRYPTLYPAVWKESFCTFAPPGGESLPQAAQRMRAFVLTAAQEHPEQTLLFVTHAGILRAFWGDLLGLPPQQATKQVPFCKNGGYAVLQVNGGDIRPLAYDAP